MYPRNVCSCTGERNNDRCVGEKIVVVAQVKECCGCLGEGTVVVVQVFIIVIVVCA